MLALKSEGPSGVFNVGTGQATSVNEIAALLCQRMAPNAVPTHVAPHPGELRYSIADVSRISASLGYRPRASMADKIDSIIDYYRSGPSRT